MVDKTIGGCVRTPCSDAFCRDARPQHWRRLWENISPIQVTSKDGHDFRSRSYGRERKITEWRQAIEEDSWQASDNESSLPRRKIKRRKCDYVSGLQHQGLLVVSVQEAK
ncbi:hypothetical protein AAG906_038843 [Vitis piasezkii]